jgi:hypothetical protein
MRPREGPAYGFGVPTGATRALIFIDIDGVPIPLRVPPMDPAHGWRSSAAGDADDCGNPLLQRFDPDDGRRLLCLPGELVWASTWMAQANEVVARPGSASRFCRSLTGRMSTRYPNAGCIGKPCPSRDGRQAVGSSGSTTRSPSPTADGSPLTTRTRHAHHRAGRTPLPWTQRRVDPQLGLTDADLAVVRQWLRQHHETA